MANIKKKIENLKPGKDYLISVRAKNADINTFSEAVDSIVVSIPKDSTIPDYPENLQLYASFEKVMFVFDPAPDIDIFYYEYELYNSSQVSGTYPNYTITGSPVSSGQSASNVFTIAVANSTKTDAGVITTLAYKGRIRSVDTSLNQSDWSPIVDVDQSTPLISSQYIDTLTASKITAGTIGAHTVNLAGSNSIIKSSNYDFNAATPNGWYIRGDGHLNFGGPFGITYNGSTVTIGTAVNVQAQLNANAITVGNGTYGYLTIDSSIGPGNADFGMELGDPTYNYWYANGKFRVGDSNSYTIWNGSTLSVKGTIDATAGNFTGTVTVGTNTTKINIVGTGTTTTTAIYSGTSTYGTGGFWLDASGRFSLANKLTFTGGNLTIDGTVTIGSSTVSTVVGNANSALQDGNGVTKNISNQITTISGTGVTITSNGNTSTGQRVILNSEGLKAYNSSNVNTVSINSDGSASFTGTITATSTINGLTASTVVEKANNSLQPGTAANDVNSNVTTISGSKIRTGVIESTGYSYASGNYSITGSQINLDNGLIRSKNFAIDSSGNAYFKGDITGASGTFTGTLNGATIVGGTISIGSLNSIFKADSNGIYLGNTTFGSAPFRVDLSGSFVATNANITGTIIATGGSITGTLSAGGVNSVQIGKNINGATDHDGIRINDVFSFGWGNAWVKRGNNSVFFRAGNNDTFIQLDTSGTNQITFKNVIDQYTTCITNVLPNAQIKIDYNNTYAPQTRNITIFELTGSYIGSILVEENGLGGWFRSWYTAYGEVNVSDARLKNIYDENVEVLDIINKINVTKYSFKSDTENKKFFGFTAQNIYEAIPEVVTVGGTDENTDPWAINLSMLVPYSIAGIKQLYIKIRSLEDRLTALEHV